MGCGLAGRPAAAGEVTGVLVGGGDGHGEVGVEALVIGDLPEAELLHITCRRCRTKWPSLLSPARSCLLHIIDETSSDGTEQHEKHYEVETL